MTTSDLPAPVVRRTDAPPQDTAALEHALRERVDGEVRFDAGSRAAQEAFGRFVGPAQRQALCALMPDFVAEPAPE
ncbi:hypothetical protein ACIRP7_37275 [Streptomyces sp. NPDC102270]|uniref:hypothetical protein n=1 Tax=Streptomyces sp. NPDC102270 TaxID=3366150 RepID=UPI00381B4E5B